MRTEKEVMEKYEELIKEYPNDMDMVQDRIICYMEDVRYKSTKNNIIEVPLEELNNYSYNIDLHISLRLFRRDIRDILVNLPKINKYVIYHRFYLEEDYSDIEKLTLLPKDVISEIENTLLYKLRRIDVPKEVAMFLKSKNFIDVLKNYKDLFWDGRDAINNTFIPIDEIQNALDDINKISILSKKGEELIKRKQVLVTNIVKQIPYQPSADDVADFLLSDPSVSIKEAPGGYIKKIIKHFKLLNKYHNFDSLFRLAVNISGIDKIPFYMIPVIYTTDDKKRELSIFLEFQEVFINEDITLLNKAICDLESFLNLNHRSSEFCNRPLTNFKIDYFRKKYKLSVQLKDNFVPPFIVKNSKCNSNDNRHIFNKAIVNTNINDYLNFSERYIPKSILDGSDLYTFISNIKKILDICPDFRAYLRNTTTYCWSECLCNKSDKSIHDQLKELLIDHEKRKLRQLNKGNIEIKNKKPKNFYRKKMFEDLMSGNKIPNPGNVKGAVCYMMDTNSFIRCRAGVTYSDIRYNIKTDKINDDDTPNCKVWINNNPKESSKIIKALFISGVIDVDNKKIHTNISMSKINMHMIFYTIKDFLEETEKNHGYKWNYSRMGGIAYIYVTMLDTLYMFCNCFGYELVD